MANMKIKNEGRKKNKDGTWSHVGEVCNNGTQDEKVKVTSWPSDVTNKKIGKKINRKEKTMTVPAGECKKFDFKFNKKPGYTYTDVLDADTGTWITGTYEGIQDVKVSKTDPPKKTVLGTLMGFYPARLESIGKTLDFYIKSISELPQGWSVISISPEVEENFTLSPDQKELQIVLQVSIPEKLEEGTIVDAEVVIGTRGYPDTSLYTTQEKIRFAVDETPPNIISLTKKIDETQSKIVFVAELEDTTSGLETPSIFYTSDNGETWNCSIMELTELKKMSHHSIIHAEYKTSIDISHKNSISFSLVAEDQFGNITRTNEEIIKPTIITRKEILMYVTAGSAIIAALASVLNFIM